MLPFWAVLGDFVMTLDICLGLSFPHPQPVRRGKAVQANRSFDAGKMVRSVKLDRSYQSSPSSLVELVDTTELCRSFYVNDLIRV